MAMAAVEDDGGGDRYSYAELKEAQRQCEARAVETAMMECGSTSKALQEIYQAHVTDKCADIFRVVVRKYNPPVKENMEEIDQEALDRVAELEKIVKAKEAAVKKLRASIPKAAAEKMRQRLEKERKRKLEVVVTAPEMVHNVTVDPAALVELKEKYDKTATVIAMTTAKISQVMSVANETISVTERAMKRPKSAIDTAMQQSPPKIKGLVVDEQDRETTAESSSLRTKLALQVNYNRAPK